MIPQEIKAHKQDPPPPRKNPLGAIISTSPVSPVPAVSQVGHKEPPLWQNLKSSFSDLFFQQEMGEQNRQHHNLFFFPL